MTSLCLFLARATLVFHFAFILFAALGPLLVLKWRRVAWAHVPALLWSVVILSTHAPCPLTPLQNWFLKCAGAEQFQGGLIENYLLPVIYPGPMTPGVRLTLLVLLVTSHAVIYGWVVYRWWRERRKRGLGSGV